MISIETTKYTLAAALLSWLCFSEPAFSEQRELTTADIKQALHDKLVSQQSQWSTGEFSADLLGVNKESLRVGSNLRFVFSTNRECFVTLIGIDSEANVSLLQPFDSGLLTVTAEAVYPNPESLEVFEVAPPTGEEHIHVLCSLEPILTGSLRGVQGHTYGGDEAIGIISTIVDRLKVLGARNYGEVSWTHRIQGRSQYAQYNHDDVVSFFTERTRSLKRKRLPLEINFEYRSAKLTAEAKSTLDMIGRALNSDSLVNQHFRIGGHTDAIGSDAYNLELSARRANSAKAYLLDRFDIADARLEVSPYGEHLPKADNTTEQGRADNRRVELEMLN